MMKEEAIRQQSNKYLKRLEVWYLVRWKRRLELLNETTADLWLIRRVLQERKMSTNANYGIIAFPKDSEPINAEDRLFKHPPVLDYDS